MRTNNCQNQELNQLPLEVVARVTPLKNLLDEFNVIGDQTHYTNIIKELCLAFTGNERGKTTNNMDACTLMFNVNFIKRALFTIELNRVSEDRDELSTVVLELLPEFDCMEVIQIIDDSITNWLDLSEWTPWNPEHLELGLGAFRLVTDLVKRFSCISLVYGNQMKGGSSC
jgi:hypothetical protein